MKFGIHIENHLDNLSTLFFGQALDQMGQKCPYLAKNASFGPKFAVFGQKSNRPLGAKMYFFDLKIWIFGAKNQFFVQWLINKRNCWREEIALLHVNPPLSFYRAHSVEDTESETFDFILKDNFSGFIEVIISFSLNSTVCSSRSSQLCFIVPSISVVGNLL